MNVAFSGSATRGGRILIIDDEMANVVLLERTLRQAGYGFLTGTTDSREALGLFLELEPDLVILDLLMPYPDGFAVLEQLRDAISPTAYVPILVLTADVSTQALRRALSEGARDFLTKPFDQTELLLRVQNLMETRLLHLGLYHQVEALEYLNAQTQDEARERRQSLSALGHDMAQPLTALIMSVDALKQELAPARWECRVCLRN